MVEVVMIKETLVLIIDPSCAEGGDAIRILLTSDKDIVTLYNKLELTMTLPFVMLTTNIFTGAGFNVDIN